MALVRCHECKSDVSSEAAKCPKCGARVLSDKERSELVRTGFAFLFKAVATLVAVGTLLWLMPLSAALMLVPAYVGIWVVSRLTSFPLWFFYGGHRALKFLVVALGLGVAYWFFRGDGKSIVVDGNTVTIGDCRQDLKHLQSLERTDPTTEFIGPAGATKRLRTHLPDTSISSCGATAHTALKQFFSLRDNYQNIKETLAGAESNASLVAEATKDLLREVEEAINAYRARKEALAKHAERPFDFRVFF